MAFTNNKEIRDDFVSQRDMSKYIEKVSKGVTKDEWKVYANSGSHRSLYLQYYTINYKYWDSNDEMAITNDRNNKEFRDGFTVLATAREITRMEAVRDNIESGGFNGFIRDDMKWPSIFIFKDKIQRALYRLWYENAWKMNTQEGSPERGECIYPEGYDPESDWSEIKADELEIFTRQMLDWFKK